MVHVYGGVYGACVWGHVYECMTYGDLYGREHPGVSGSGGGLRRVVHVRAYVYVYVYVYVHGVWCMCMGACVWVHVYGVCV